MEEPKNPKRRPDLYPPPLSLKERERARIKRAKGRIHEVIVRHFPTCRRRVHLRGAEDEAENFPDQFEDGWSAGAGAEDLHLPQFYNRLCEQAGTGQTNKGQRERCAGDEKKVEATECQLDGPRARGDAKKVEATECQLNGPRARI